ncbi:MAG TPA: neutral zinc metallopeptidase [Ilumatobacteraceae bacterium]|nr:neutral zinc metallopeptidase [Ilumatobacteraceae bacterium]
MTKIRSRSSSRVRDRRGASGGGGGSGFGFPMGGGGGGGRGIPMGAGGGLVGLLILAAIVILPRLLGSGGGGTGNSALTPAADEASGPVACETELEQVVCGAVDDVSLYWEDQFPVSFQGAFPGTDTVFFSGATMTGCGQATAQTGPFYCPADQLVYFDLDFLQQLQDDFGATGDLAAQYIFAHEYGHHIQTVTGISDRVRGIQQQSPDVANEFSVALELQADCFAGAWASSVAERGLFDRPNEIEEALAAAEAVGDDRIMESAGQEVDPDSFTHGTAEQRRTWFETGFQTGDPEACRTFNDALAP